MVHTVEIGMARSQWVQEKVESVGPSDEYCWEQPKNAFFNTMSHQSYYPRGKFYNMSYKDI